jgi:hypothetical protein
MNFFLDHLSKFLVLLFVLVFLAAVSDAQREKEQRDKFMVECMRDHKEYECVAMWRRGEDRIVPMPIVIPVR